MKPEALEPSLIAPCGMDCGLCLAYLRQKNRCLGCNGDDAGKPKSCVACRIKNCDELEAAGAGFCYACAVFPCPRLRRLDARYRNKYGMSMLENLRTIGRDGPVVFAENERTRWTCPECGDVVCVHRPACLSCGHPRDLGPE